MDSVNAESAVYGSQNEYTLSDTVLSSPLWQGPGVPSLVFGNVVQNLSMPPCTKPSFLL